MASSSQIIAEADALWKQGKLQESLDVCLSGFQGAEPGSDEEKQIDPQLIFRAARAYYLLGEEEEKQTKTNQAQYEEGWRLAQLAMQLAPKDSDVVAWNGVCLGGAVKFMPAKQQIAEAYTIRNRFKEAFELDPTNGNALQCYGAWCYEITQIGWLSRQAATVLFGAPPTSSLDDAEKYLLEARKYSDKTTELWIEGYLGMVYHKMDKNEEALKALDAALAVPALTQQQQRYKAKLSEKRSKCEKKLAS